MLIWTSQKDRSFSSKLARVGDEFGVQKGYIIDINSDRQLTGPVMKAQSVLDQWYRSNGFMASHKMLIQAFISQGDADLAERVCRIAKQGQKIVV